jgi:hypothetical protein
MSAALLRKARHELGTTGLVALALFAIAAMFHFLALKPLESRNALLEDELARAESIASGRGAGAAGNRLAAFYRYFETGESATDWLARLNDIGARAGVKIPSADYRLQKTGTRIERYEVVLPLTGSYPQIRSFLAQALAEIPVLSLDQVTIKKERAQGGSVQAEARMTLHLSRP